MIPKIDRRTRVGKALAAWCDDLARDLGGLDALSTPQKAIIEQAVTTRLLLDSIDAWLMRQPSLVDRRKRALLPVVRERQALADALVRCLTALGLERKARELTDLASYLAARSDSAPEVRPRGAQQAAGRSAARNRAGRNETGTEHGQQSDRQPDSTLPLRRNVCKSKRRGRDSNPRGLAPCRFSSAAAVVPRRPLSSRLVPFYRTSRPRTSRRILLGPSPSHSVDGELDGELPAQDWNRRMTDRRRGRPRFPPRRSGAQSGFEVSRDTQSCETRRHPVLRGCRGR